MKIQFIRNATMILEYSGQRLLIDPMLCANHSFRSFAGISENPTVDLPAGWGVDEVLNGIDGVMVSHLHPDHFDEVAQQRLDKTLPVFTQPESGEAIAEMGFNNVISLSETVEWGGIQITPTPGEHGFGDWVERMGPVTGFLFNAPDEPSLYWMGDSILYPAVTELLKKERPAVVVTHSGGAQFQGADTRILMDAAETVALAQVAGSATIVAVHMEALDHCRTSRVALQAAAEEAGIADRLLIPADGELIELEQ